MKSVLSKYALGALALIVTQAVAQELIVNRKPTPSITCGDGTAPSGGSPCALKFLNGTRAFCVDNVRSSSRTLADLSACAALCTGDFIFGAYCQCADRCNATVATSTQWTQFGRRISTSNDVLDALGLSMRGASVENELRRLQVEGVVNTLSKEESERFANLSDHLNIQRELLGGSAGDVAHCHFLFGSKCLIFAPTGVRMITLTRAGMEVPLTEMISGGEPFAEYAPSTLFSGMLARGGIPVTLAKSGSSLIGIPAFLGVLTPTGAAVASVANGAQGTVLTFTSL